ncbi:hypothetical protein [Aeromonas salmonicida]|uniref:hypothetical protein n=1 Tax=Aeromonas salmonicida TaxID=645 RepID=UPI003D708B94
MKRFTHDADLRGMVVLRSLGFQLVPFKLHRFRKQRRLNGKGRVIRLCQPVSSSSLLSCRSLLRPAVVIVTSLKTFVYDSDYPFIFSCLPISFRSFSFLV